MGGDCGWCCIVVVIVRGFWLLWLVVVIVGSDCGWWCMVVVIVAGAA